ncbi:hypothetical protein F5X99DRAFT_381057 [Biscogniauxia marginata]|nr:hypothetical protein F5X99DRAFT_381057 [Biscogniauxia marginata]
MSECFAFGGILGCFFPFFLFLVSGGCYCFSNEWKDKIKIKMGNRREILKMAAGITAWTNGMYYRHTSKNSQIGRKKSGITQTQANGYGGTREALNDL